MRSWALLWDIKHPGQGKRECLGFVSPEPRRSSHFSSGMIPSATSWGTGVLGTQGRALFSSLHQTSAKLLHLPAQILLSPASKKQAEGTKIFSFSPLFLPRSARAVRSLEYSHRAFVNTTGRREQSQLCPAFLWQSLGNVAFPFPACAAWVSFH